MRWRYGSFLKWPLLSTTSDTILPSSTALQVVLSGFDFSGLSIACALFLGRKRRRLVSRFRANGQEVMRPLHSSPPSRSQILRRSLPLQMRKADVAQLLRPIHK
jgi:hypothetical protein